MARYLIAMTGASGVAYGVDLVKRCPGEKFLILSDWARHVLADETGLKPADLEPHVKKLSATPTSRRRSVRAATATTPWSCCRAA